jgi:predicted nucleic acid-binding protein
MAGTLLLDSEGLSRLYRQEPRMLARVEVARGMGLRIGTTTMTRLEAEHGRVHRSRIAWTLSHLDVHPITRAISDAAAELLRTHGLSGHKHAIDAALAAVARSSTKPVAVATSDPDDLRRLCGPGIAIITL